MKNNRNNYDKQNNHLWGPLISIQMQCQYLIKLLNKRKMKSLQKKKYNSHTKTTMKICANAQHLANKIEYVNI
jgi:hypothetical protein